MCPLHPSVTLPGTCQTFLMLMANYTADLVWSWILTIPNVSTPPICDPARNMSEIFLYWQQIIWHILSDPKSQTSQLCPPYHLWPYDDHVRHFFILMANYRTGSSLILNINPLRLRQNRRHFADNVFKCNFLKMKMFEFRLRFHWSLFLKALGLDELTMPNVSTQTYVTFSPPWWMVSVLLKTISFKLTTSCRYDKLIS